MRVTVDTNFLISSTQWDNSVAHKLLGKFIMSNVEMFTTRGIIDEFAKVLQRDFYYTKEETKNITQRVLDFLIIIKTTKKLNVIKEDPDDNKILECAISSKSEYILTYDNHLLKLREFRGIKILRPEEIRFL